MFDTAGTLMGVAQRAHLVKEDGRIENLSKAMKADSASSVFGGMLGVPPVTSYAESAAGVPPADVPGSPRWWSACCSSPRCSSPRWPG